MNVHVEQTDTTPEPLGARIRDARRREGLTAAAAVDALQAAGCDVTVRALGSIERGEREPRLSEAFAFRDVLDVDIEPAIADQVYVSLTVAEPGGRTHSVTSLVPDGEVESALSAVYTTTLGRYQ